MSASPGPIPEHMDDKTAPQTAARRYSEGRLSEWTQTYRDLQAEEKFQTENLFNPGWNYSEQAFGIFPRYRFDKATKIEVERLVPHASKGLQQSRALLIGASGIAEERLCGEFKNEAALKALREESDAYEPYTCVLSEADLLSILPLPFRRVLPIEESQELWNQPKLVGGIGEGYWFPLKEGPLPANILALHVDYIKAADGVAVLRDALTRPGISRVFELREFDPEEPNYEIELSIFEPGYRWGGEQYCAAAGVGWVVCASQESSITLVGGWLVEIHREKWSGCIDHIDGGPYPTNDLRDTGKWD